MLYYIIITYVKYEVCTLIEFTRIMTYSYMVYVYDVRLEFRIICTYIYLFTNKVTILLYV